MASTIQIKRGTGSAVPSGLADGELAINLDDGRFYFGSGSTSVNSFRFTNLIADNYTVSSSVTNYVFQTLSGSSDFGDDVADIHNRTGSMNILGSLTSTNTITAEHITSTDDMTVTDDLLVNGNISGSSTSTIHAGGYTVDSFNFANFNAGTFQLAAGAGVTQIDIGKSNAATPVFANGSITSSNNISASGDVIANTGSFNHLVMDDGTFIAHQIIAQDTDESPAASINLKDADGNSIAGLARLGSGDNAHRGQLFLRDNANLKVQIKAHGDSYFNGTSAQVGIGNDSPGKTLDVTGEIRASGDITANGNIVGDGSTNITSVDTITGDGTITMSDVTIDGTLNNGTPILSFTSSGYSPVGGITYAGGTDAGNRYALMFAGLDENLVSLCNRQHNGRVDIRANNSTAGPSGEVTASLFTHNSVQLLLPVTASGNISASGDIIANKLNISSNITASGDIKATGTNAALRGEILSIDPDNSVNQYSRIARYTSGSENSVNVALQIGVDATSSAGDFRGNIANGYGVALSFTSNRDDANPSTTYETGRIISYMKAGAQTTSDQHGMKFQIRNDDTNIEALTIMPGSPDSDAKVGIMDTTPSYTLDVNGDIRCTDDLFVNDDATITGKLQVNESAIVDGYISSSDTVYVDNDIRFSSNHAAIFFDDPGNEYTFGIGQGGLIINAGITNPASINHFIVSSSGGTGANENARIGMGVTPHPTSTLNVSGSITYGTPAVTQGTAKIVISTADANALHTTPITLVPAQGANTVIIPVGGMVRVDRAATQLNSAANMDFHYAGVAAAYSTTSLVHLRRFMYNDTGDRVFAITTPAIEISQNLTDDVNAALQVSVSSALTTDCITSITIYLTYNVFDIS